MCKTTWVWGLSPPRRLTVARLGRVWSVFFARRNNQISHLNMELLLSTLLEDINKPNNGGINFFHVSISIACNKSWAWTREINQTNFVGICAKNVCLNIQDKTFLYILMHLECVWSESTILCCFGMYNIIFVLATMKHLWTICYSIYNWVVYINIKVLITNLCKNTPSLNLFLSIYHSAWYLTKTLTLSEEFWKFERIK